MALDRLTKIDGGGISTTSDYRVGIITATKFIGPIEGSITSTDATFTGDVSIGGTLTYEDVTNIDSVGLITARGGIHIDDSIVHIGDENTKIRFPSNDNFSIETSGSERVRLNNNSFILKNNVSLGVGGYANPLLSGYNGAVFQLHQSSSGSSVGAQIRFTINDLGTSNTDGMFLSYWGNKYFYLQQRETGGGYLFQNRDSNGNLITALTINSDSNIEIDQDLDVDGHTNLDNVSIAGVTTASGNLKITGGTLSLDAGGSERFNVAHVSGGTVLVKNPSNAALNFGTNNLTRIQITNDGKVQIGLPGNSTSLPAGTEVVNIRAMTNGNLHIRQIGNIASSPTGTGVGIDVLNDASNTVTDLAIRGSTVIFRSPTAETLRINSDGEIGINNTNPLHLLHISSTSSTSNAPALIRCDNDLSGKASYMLFSNTTDSKIAYFGLDGNGMFNIDPGAALVGTNGSEPIIFATNGNSEKLRITSDGKIGIGNNNPSYPLVLTYTNNTTYSSSNFIANGLQIENTSTTDNTASGIFFTAKGSGANAGAAHINCIRTANGSGTLTFSTRHNVGSHTERLRITSDGKLLVGRTSASHSSSNMEIYGGGEAYLRISPSTNTGTAAVVFGTADDHSTGGIFYQGSDDALVFAGYNNTERLRITGTGRVNIGDNDQSQNVDQFSVTVGATNAIDNVARFQSNAAASGTSETLVKIYKGSGYGGVISGYITQGSDHGLKLYTSNNGALSERLRINSTGHVLKPSNPGFFARPPGNYAISGDQIVGGTWSTSDPEAFVRGTLANGNSCWDNSTGIFTVPVTGIYYIHWNVFLHNNTTRRDAFIFNGSTVIARNEIGDPGEAANNKNVAVTAVVSLSVNNQIKFGVLTTGTTNRIYPTARPWSYACAYLVG